MPSTPSTSDEPIEGVVEYHPGDGAALPSDEWDRLIPGVGIDVDGKGGFALHYWPDQGMDLMMQVPEPQPSAHFVVNHGHIYPAVPPEAVAFVRSPNTRG